MIREITDPVERERVFARARVFAGSDEQFLAPEWLARPDVYCVAQENDWNGYHDDPKSLLQALGVFPGARWCAVRNAGRQRLSDPFEVNDPLSALTASLGVDRVASYYHPSGFLLFSMDCNAVILYSPDCEYRLIAGDARFVRAYIDGAKIDPLQELRDWFQEDLDEARRDGIEKRVVALERTLAMALSQVKLPPPASALK